MRDIKQFVLTTFSGFYYFLLLFFFVFSFRFCCLVSIWFHLSALYLPENWFAFHINKLSFISFHFTIFLPLRFYFHIIFFNFSTHTLGQRSIVLVLFVALTFSSFCAIIFYPCGNCYHYLLTVFSIRIKLYIFFFGFNSTLIYLHKYICMP